MNKKYIKRQLTLDNLGLPMDKDIQEYYNVFKKYINKDELVIDTEYDKELVSYSIPYGIILAYEKGKHRFHMIITIYEDFKYDCNLRYQSAFVDDLLCAFLEYHFNLKTIGVNLF